MVSLDNIIIILLTLIASAAQRKEEKQNVFRILDSSRPIINITEPVFWLQGISHIIINSTILSNTPVQVIWDFKYYKVGFHLLYIVSLLWTTKIFTVEGENNSIQHVESSNFDISYLHHKRPVKLLGL